MTNKQLVENILKHVGGTANIATDCTKHQLNNQIHGYFIFFHVRPSDEMALCPPVPPEQRL